MQMYLCKLFKEGRLEEKIFRIAESKKSVKDWLAERQVEGEWQIQLCQQDKPTSQEQEQ